MLFQASNCNQQIPAKIYEYLYSGKPILGFTDPVGDTGQLLKRLNIASIAPLDDKEKIKSALLSFLDALRKGSLRVPSRARSTSFHVGR